MRSYVLSPHLLVSAALAPPCVTADHLVRPPAKRGFGDALTRYGPVASMSPCALRGPLFVGGALARLDHTVVRSLFGGPPTPERGLPACPRRPKLCKRLSAECAPGVAGASCVLHLAGRVARAHTAGPCRLCGARLARPLGLKLSATRITQLQRAGFSAYLAHYGKLAVHVSTNLVDVVTRLARRFLTGPGLPISARMARVRLASISGIFDSPHDRNSTAHSFSSEPARCTWST